MTTHIHGDPSLECTYEQTWHQPCPFAGERFFPSWACHSCGQRKPEHLEGCRKAPAKPRATPCLSCPYRRDVPSGIWAASEYDKLPEYDQPTALQPMGVFMCHQRGGEACAGWAGCHNQQDHEHDLLALRFTGLNNVDAEAVRAYVSPVPLFASGAEAAEHGKRDIEHPSAEAIEKVGVVTRIMDRQRQSRAQ